MERDTQRKKVYLAERVLSQKRIGDGSVKEIKLFVRDVWKWVRKQDFGLRWESVPLVFDGRGRRKAGGCDEFITLPRWARTYATVLHELAHTIVWRTRDGELKAGHGREFAWVFLQLVRRWHPDRHEAAKALRESFAGHNVKYRLPKDSPMRKKPQGPYRVAAKERA